MKHLLTIGLLLTSMIALGHNPYYIPSSDEYQLKNNDKVVGELMKIENDHVFILQEEYTVKKVPLSHFDQKTKQAVLIALGEAPVVRTLIAENSKSSSNSTIWAIVICTSTLIALILTVIMINSRKRLFNI